MSSLTDVTSSTEAEIADWLRSAEGEDWIRRTFHPPHNQSGRIVGTRMFSLEPIVGDLKGCYRHRGYEVWVDRKTGKETSWEEFADQWVINGSRHV